MQPEPPLCHLPCSSWQSQGLLLSPDAGITSCPTRPAGPPSIFHLNDSCNTPGRPPLPSFTPQIYTGGLFCIPHLLHHPCWGVPSSSRVQSRAPQVVMELWEPAQEQRRDHTGQCPSGRRMGISAPTKKHQQAPRTAFVTNLSCCQGKTQLLTSQLRVPGCKGTPLPLRSGWVRGERAAARQRGAPPRCPSHPAAHHPHLRPPTRSQWESADRFSHRCLQRAGRGKYQENPSSTQGVCSALRGKATRAARPTK